jgi:hypothetical protein
MATGPPLGRGEDAESIEGNRLTRTEEANRELPVAMANLMKYLEEQGMEVPAASQPSPQLGKD